MDLTKIYHADWILLVESFFLRSLGFVVALLVCSGINFPVRVHNWQAIQLYHRVQLSRIPGYNILDKQAQLSDANDRHVARNMWHARLRSLTQLIPKTSHPVSMAYNFHLAPSLFIIAKTLSCSAELDINNTQKTIEMSENLHPIRTKETLIAGFETPPPVAGELDLCKLLRVWEHCRNWQLYTSNRNESRRTKLP